MRNLIIVFISLFTFCIGISGQQKCKLNVGSFNLRYDNEGDKDDSWVHRKDMAVSLVHFHDFDVFGIQEGLIHQVKELVKDDTYTYVGVGRDDGKEAGEHAAVLFKKDRFKLLDSGNYWLSETQDKPSFGWDAQCRRVCSWAKLKDKVSGKEFYFFSVHFDHIGKVARHESALIMLANIKKIAGDSPAICVGDFNVDQHNESYLLLDNSGIMRDSYQIADFRYVPNGTFNAFHADRKTDSRIDHLFLTKEFDVKKYGVLTDTYRSEAKDAKNEQNANFPKEVSMQKHVARVPSDHFPVMIVVEVK